VFDLDKKLFSLKLLSLTDVGKEVQRDLKVKICFPFLKLKIKRWVGIMCKKDEPKFMQILNEYAS
jgi:hypothetical protein